MKSMGAWGSGFALMVAALVCLPLAVAAPVAAGTPPVPAPIPAAHKIFIANGGEDAGALLQMAYRNRTEETYALFYSAMQAAGKWQLVNSPEGADLVLVVRLTQSARPDPTNYGDGLVAEVEVLDGKTGLPLWDLTQALEGATLERTWEKNYASGVDALAGQFQELSSGVAAKARAIPFRGVWVRR